MNTNTNLDKILESLNKQIEELETKQSEINKENNTNIELNNNQDNINIWELNEGKYCYIIKTYEELINYIKQNKNTKIILHDKQKPNTDYKYTLDYLTDIYNKPIIYTDNEHPINIIKSYENDSPTIIINPTFLKKYEKEYEKDIKEIILEIIKTKPQYIYIPDILITDEFINFITSSEDLKDTNIEFEKTTNKELTEEQINNFKNNHLAVWFKDINISSNHVISWYTINKLKEKDILQLDTDLSDTEINNFIYIRNDTKIILEHPFYEDKNEHIYLNNLKHIFNILKNHQRTYNIEIKIENRELLKQSGLLSYSNINLTINNDYYKYNHEEYLKEEEQLDKLIKPIKESNLSPYEKYLAVYNIVKQFKPYKENEEDKDQSRYLRYILNNEYIVCVGYARLLTTLLDKINIPSIEIGADVDISKYNDEIENIPTKLAGHERNIVKIDDDKYNIHGIFIVDSTWDNNMIKDLYNNSTSTFDKRKEYRRLEKLTNEDLLLDFHNFEEYLEKINYFLKRSINRKNPFIIPDQTHQEKILNAYYEIYEEIMNILYKLDYSKHQELYNKYNNQIKQYKKTYENMKYYQNKDDISTTEIENLFSNFLTDYATYIIPLSNQTVNLETTLTSASVIKKEIYNFNNEELIKWKKQTLDENIIQQNNSFPYVYNPFNPRPNYLQENPPKKK